MFWSGETVGQALSVGCHTLQLATLIDSKPRGSGQCFCEDRADLNIPGRAKLIFLEGVGIYLESTTPFRGRFVLRLTDTSPIGEGKRFHVTGIFT